MTTADDRQAFARPAKGRKISGVAAFLAARTGLGAGLVRCALLLAVLAGAALVIAFGIFDHALFGGPGPLAVRLVAVLSGVLLILLYPLLAVAIPDGRPQPGWDLGSAVGMLLLLMLGGQVLGMLLDRAPFLDVAKDVWAEKGWTGWFTWFDDYERLVGWSLREALLLLFFLSFSAFVWLQRASILRFLRAMQVGVSLVVLATLAVAVGVLIPQIDGFEDPTQRVDLTAERADHELFKEFGYESLPQSLQDGNEQYQAFRWAEGYFLYHALHLYGVGMPTGVLPAEAEKGLEVFGRKYGYEEASNREKQMRATFSGQEKLKEIAAFIQRNEDHFWRFFEASTLLDLNRTYKSHWFTTLLTVLGLAAFASAYKNWKPSLRKLPMALVGGGVAAFWVFFLRLSGAIHGEWATSMYWVAFVLVAGVLLGLGVPKSSVSLQKLGFFVVHNGMLVLLIGGAMSKLFTVRGILHLDLREGPKSVFWAYFDPEKKMELPFEVQLEHFARRDWKALEVYFFDTERELTSRPPRYTLWPGRTIDFDYREGPDGEVTPRLRVVVKELYDRAEPQMPTVTERTSGEILPLAELTVNDAHLVERDHQHTNDPSHDHERRELLFPLAMQGRVYVDPLGGFRLATAYEEDLDALAEVFPAASSETIGTLRIEVDGQPGAGRTERIEKGQELTLPGGYTVRVVDVTNDFRTGRDDERGSQHPLPLERQPFGIRALWVDIRSPEAGRPPERRILIEGLDWREQGEQPRFDYPDVVLNYRGDDWEMPGPPRYLLTWTEAMEKPVLVGEDGRRTTADPGGLLELPFATDTRVHLERVYDRADFEANPRFLPPVEGEGGWDADFYARTPRGALLEVIQDPLGERPEVHQVRLASTQQLGADVWRDPVGFETEAGRTEPRFALRFLENSEMLPFEWRSVLAFFERDEAGNRVEVPMGPEHAREIRVNDYLTYKGYRFFQTNAIPDMPTYSGVGVVYDPGIEPVLIGMYTVIGGAVIAFLIRPIVLDRRRQRKGAVLAAASGQAAGGLTPPTGTGDSTMAPDGAAPSRQEQTTS